MGKDGTDVARQLLFDLETSNVYVGERKRRGVERSYCIFKSLKKAGIFYESFLLSLLFHDINGKKNV